jgi:hypothetical protein
MQQRISTLLRSVHFLTPYLLCGTRLLCLIFFTVLTVLAQPLQAKEQSIEYKVKAAYIYNFSKFTDWPDDFSFEKHQSFTICILGKDPFGTAINPIENKTVHGHHIKLIYFSQMNSKVSTCKILFIAEAEEGFVQSILLALSNTRVLTIGESPNFATSGGIIGFVIRDGRVQLQINETAAAQAKLNFDPRLLKLGELVETIQ